MRSSAKLLVVAVFAVASIGVAVTSDFAASAATSQQQIRASIDSVTPIVVAQIISPINGTTTDQPTTSVTVHVENAEVVELWINGVLVATMNVATLDPQNVVFGGISLSDGANVIVAKAINNTHVTTTESLPVTVTYIPENPTPVAPVDPAPPNTGDHFVIGGVMVAKSTFWIVVFAMLCVCTALFLPMMRRRHRKYDEKTRAVPT